MQRAAIVPPSTMIAEGGSTMTERLLPIPTMRNIGREMKPIIVAIHIVDPLLGEGHSNCRGVFDDGLNITTDISRINYWPRRLSWLGEATFYAAKVVLLLGCGYIKAHYKGRPL